MFLFDERVARMVGRDKAERLARNEVSKCGVSASEDGKRYLTAPLAREVGEYLLFEFEGESEKCRE